MKNNTAPKKKIAVIDMDNLKSSFWGAGQARATREVFKRLSSEFDITIYTAKYPGYRDYQEEGLTYTHVGVLHANSRVTNALFVLGIPWLVRSLQADLIIENFNAPISTSGAPWFTNTPVLGIPTMFNALEFSKKYHLPFHYVEWFLMQAYRYMVAYSDIDSAKMKRINKKIYSRIIPQGVSEEFFQISHKKPEYILFLGRFDMWQKGIDLLLKSYAMIAHTFKIPLIIAGKGPDEHEIVSMIKKLSLESLITVKGPAYGAEKEELISKAHCVVFPSRHDELSLWALEALGSGLPLVTFDLPEGRWMGDRAVLKAKPFDCKEYAQKIIEAVVPANNTRMRVEARTLAAQYTWDSVADKYRQYIHDIITSAI